MTSYQGEIQAMHITHIDWHICIHGASPTNAYESKYEYMQKYSFSSSFLFLFYFSILVTSEQDSRANNQPRSFTMHLVLGLQIMVSTENPNFDHISSSRLASSPPPYILYVMPTFCSRAANSRFCWNLNSNRNPY